MLRVRYSKNEPDSVPLVDIGSGGLFKIQKGHTPYMVVILTDGMGLPKSKIATVSLESGQIHMFDQNHPVVELDGTLELSRIRIERRK